jgi:hypothetical protein
MLSLLLLVGQPLPGFRGRVTSRISGDEPIQGFFSGCPVIHFLLAAGNVEHGVWCLGAVGIGFDQFLLVADGILEVAKGVIRVADPVLGTGSEAGPGMVFDKLIEMRNRFFIFACLE